ncbi:MAG TPA: hypothetical protein VF774_02495 [Pseudoduganella sp.]|jgi:hypothetical protein
MKRETQHGAAPRGLSDAARARLRMLAELAGVLLATVMLAATLVVTVEVLCERSVQSQESASASGGWACGLARVIDALASNVDDLVARSAARPAMARSGGPASGCRAA